MTTVRLLGQICRWIFLAGKKNIQHPRHSSAPVRLLLMIALAGLGMHASGQINISYIGPDRIHLTYAYSAGGEQAEVVFQVTDPGGGTRVLAQASGANASVSGSLCDSDLGAGDCHYAIRARWYDNEAKTWSDWTTQWSSTAYVDGTTATGTLLFDVSLSAATLDRVTVPAGRILTLKGTLSASSNGFFAVSADGTLAFDTTDGDVSLLPYPRPDMAANDPFIVRLHGNGQVVSGVTGGYFVIDGENTSVSQCHNIRIFPSGGDLTLASVSNGVVDVSYLQAGRTLYATDSALSASSVLYNGTLDLERVSWSGNLTVSGAGAIQASACDFDGYVEIGNTGFHETYSGSFQASGSRFNALHVDRAGPGLVSVNDCLFSGISGDVIVFGGAPSFTGCEFGGRVQLIDRSQTVIQSSLFLKELSFYNSHSFEHAFYAIPNWSEEGPAPVISGNAFMGDCALRFTGDLDGLAGYDASYPPSPIAIGANYYGTPNGTFNDEFGVERGYLPAAYKARVRGNENGDNASAAFSLAEPLTSSPLSGTRKDTRVFPLFWVNGHIIGQNTIAHQQSTISTSDDRILIKGRDTLLSVDLSCTEERLEKVRVYAVWNGVTVEATEKPEVRRDPASFSPALIRFGRATFDFVLPGVQSGSTPLEVFLDTSDVTGFDENARPAEDSLLFSGTVSFCDPPQRTLTIEVIPVAVSGITGSWGTGDAGATVKALRENIPDLLSIPAKRVNVQQGAPLEVWSSTAFLTSIGMLNRVSAGLAAGRWLRSQATADTPDFIVAVMPSGLITFGAEGASFVGRRRIAFVDEQKPMAVLHELGHAVGLYTDTEEYDLYPPDGLPIEGATLFMTETGGTRGRARHLPSKENAWYTSGLAYDTMGSAEPSAPLPGTVAAFHTWFQENLTATTASGVTAFSVQGFPRKTSETAAGMRRILLSGASDSDYSLLPETLTFFDVTALATAERAPSEGVAYRFQALDGNGLQIYDASFIQEWNTAEWLATFDIPSEAVTVRVVDTTRSIIVKELSTCGLQSVTLNVNAPDGEIGPTFTAHWSVQSERVPDAGQLTHSLYYRTGLADPWHLIVGPTCATNIETHSTFLPDAETLSLKLVSSDGLSSVETLADGFSVSPRPPVVNIASPLAGTLSQSNAVWRLEATVIDFTPGITSTGVWSSSIQGVLGSGPLFRTGLIPGEHLLRYEAFGGNGLTASAEVSVSVIADMTTSDIGFDSENLHLYNSHADPAGLTLLYVATGETNRFDLTIRNGGADTTARVRLYLTTPRAGESLASTVELSAAPFEEYHVPLAFLAEADGDYTVRAVLDQTDPPDANLTDNERQWTFSSPTTVTVSANPDYGGNVQGGGLYLDGISATVSATPQPGFAFSCWTEAGAEVSTNANYTFEAVTNRTLVANFTATQAIIAIACLPSAGGTASGDGAHAIGEEATISAVPNTGYRFVNWTALDQETWSWPEVSTNAQYSFTVDGDLMLRANFEAIEVGDVAIEEALDAPALTFSTDQDAPWSGTLLADAVEGGDAVHSGSIGDDGTTWMDVTVEGPGTLSFWWKASSEAGYDYGQLYVDGNLQTMIDGITDWSRVSAELGAGTHSVSWKYVKDEFSLDGDDCIWVDAVVFAPASGTGTTTTPVWVPHSWIDGYPDLLSASGGNYETAALADFDLDGHQAWQEYVAGTDPTNGVSVLRVSLTTDGGSPHITWSPDLGSARRYAVEGKAHLNDPEWSTTNAASRYFRVSVQLP